MPPRKFSSVHSIRIKDSVCRPCASPTGFNTHQHFCYSLLPQPDRILRTQVKTVHQPIGALQVIRAYLNSSTLKQLAPIWSPQLLRMSAIVLDLVSKGRLSAFGRVSFVTFLWRNKEKFSIRSNTYAYRFCLSPTGKCVLNFSLTINLSVQCKLSAPI